MYSETSERTWVDPREGDILEVVHSINNPAVEVSPARGVEKTQAFIITRRVGRGTDVLIYFHLMQSKVGLVFEYTQSPVPAKRVGQAQEEAADFLLSLGFELDNLNIDALPTKQRAALLNELPFARAAEGSFSDRTANASSGALDESDFEISTGDLEIAADPSGQVEVDLDVAVVSSASPPSVVEGTDGSRPMTLAFDVNEAQAAAVIRLLAMS